MSSKNKKSKAYKISSLHSLYIALLYKTAIIIIICLIYSSINALPQGGVVADGQVTIETSPNYMQINQATQSAIINWQTFNIGADEHTHFNQPNSQSLAINRVNAANGSSAIFGQLSSTGQIFLLNPAGVLFGPTAQINVGSILASTSDINMDAYKQGLIQLSPNLNYLGPQGSIINQGKILVQDHGYAAFVAPHVVNSGLIRANLGHVQLSSGEYFTVDLYGDNLIHLKVPEDKLNAMAKDYKVIHDGEIYANGGSIVISAADANDIVSSIISMDGLMQADSISGNSGKIILSANDQGYLNFGSNSYISAAGGYVKASAQNINLASNSIIDVSSKSSNGNAGEVYIGGNYQGKLLAENDFNAKTVVMEKDATILANADSNGDGGKIVLWSDNKADIAGNLEAKGGLVSGNGGLIETSGKYNLNIDPNIQVSTKSQNYWGTDGQWLLDPIILVVDDSLAAIISNALISNNVTITTDDGQPPLLNQEDFTPLTSNLLAGLNLADYDPRDISSGDVVFINTIGGFNSSANNTPISWNTPNKFTVIAADDIHFGLPDNINTANFDAKPLLSTAIESTGSGGIHLQTNSDASSLIASDIDAYGQFYQYFYNAVNNGTLSPTEIAALLPTENAVVSSGNGLVELYSDHDPLSIAPAHISGTRLGALDLDIITNHPIVATAGPGYMGFVNVEGNPGGGILPSQLIDYQLVYNDPATRRTVFDINNALLYGVSGPYQSFALNNNINMFFSGSGSLFDGIGGPVIGLGFLGSFDGLGYTINGLSNDGTGNRGFFNEVSSFEIANLYPNFGQQLFKNVIFQDSHITAYPDSVNSSGLDLVNAGVLIGHANVADFSALTISNIQIFGPTDVNTNFDPISGQTIYGNAGAVIGQAQGLNNSALNLSDIRVHDAIVNSSHKASGVIAETDISTITLDGQFVLTNNFITAALSTPIANDDINGLASTFASGILANTLNIQNPFSIIDASTSNIQLKDNNIYATNGLATTNTYAAGLFGNITGNTVTLNEINIYGTVNNILAEINRPIPSTVINTTNNAYSGGVFAKNTSAITTFNGQVDINTSIDSLITSLGNTAVFKSYTGGLAGDSALDNLTINNQVTIQQTPTSSIIIDQTTNSESFAGGLFGKETHQLANYNSDITTNGAISNITLTDTTSAGNTFSSAGGLSGLNSNLTTLFNGGSIVVGDILSTFGEVRATNNSSNAIANAGGLYGTMDNTFANLVIDHDLLVNSNINSSITGLSTIPNTTGFFESYAGGVAGHTIASSLLLNNNVVIKQTPTSIINVNEATNVQSFSGGLFGREDLDSAIYTANISTNGATSYIDLTDPASTAPTLSYAGGLSGMNSNLDTLFTGGTITIGDLTSVLGNISATSNSNEASAFAGGLYGSIPFAIASLNIDHNITVNSDISSSIIGLPTVPSGTGNFISYAGGIAGNTNLTSATFNGNIIVNKTPTSTINAIQASDVRSFAGGLFGSEYFQIANYNANINTNGATSNLDLTDTSSLAPTLSYAGGLSGLNLNSDTEFNGGTITIGDLSSLGDVNAVSNSNEASAFAGGLYGSINEATALFIMDHSVTVNSNINSQVTGLPTIPSGTGNFRSYAGGVAGNANLNAVFFNSNILVNETPSSTIDVTQATNVESFAGGLFGREEFQIANYNANINTNGATSNLDLTDTSSLAPTLSYAGGLSGLNLNTDTKFNGGVITIGDTSSVVGAILAVSNSNEASAFTGGLYGAFNLGTPATLLMNHSILVNSNIDSSISRSGTVPNNAGNFTSYAGGLSGDINLETAIFNSNINIKETPTSTITVFNASNVESFAGGLFGKEELQVVGYNNTINTNGAVSDVEVSDANTTIPTYSYAGGLSGLNTNESTSFNNGVITIGDTATSAILGNIRANNNSNGATSFAGGLYGVSMGSSSSTIQDLLIQDDVLVHSSIFADTKGDAINILNVTQKFTDSPGMGAGGLIAYGKNTDVTINSLVEINSAQISATTEADPLNEALQAAGGMFGIFANSSFFFDEHEFEFQNNSAMVNNSISHTGYTAGVIAYLDIEEEDPTTLAGITYGEIHKDAPNDRANWKTGQGLFTYSTAQPCQGPSAGLCNRAYIPTAQEVFNHLPTQVIHTIETHTSTSSNAHEGETHSHAPHVPHNDHRSHHNDVSEFVGEFENPGFENVVLTDGFPNTSFITENGKLILIPFKLEGHHGFGEYHRDSHGLFSRARGGEHH